jgi:hypothetical protein
MIGIGAKTAAQKIAEMSRTKIDGYRPDRLQRERVKAQGSFTATDGATIFFRWLDERFRLAEDEQFLAVGAISFAGNPVPTTFGSAAPAAGNGQGNGVGLHNPHGIHSVSPLIGPIRRRGFAPAVMEPCSSFFGFAQK